MWFYKFRDSKNKVFFALQKTRESEINKLKKIECKIKLKLEYMRMFNLISLYVAMTPVRLSTMNQLLIGGRVQGQ